MLLKTKSTHFTILTKTQNEICANLYEEIFKTLPKDPKLGFFFYK